MWVIILQRLFLEALFDIIYWPVWWYTGGVVYAGKKSVAILALGNEWLAPGIWLQNIFVPMYGQHDFGGRAISFFMRSVNVIARGFALAVWFFVCLLVFVLWLVLPVFIVASIIRSL